MRSRTFANEKTRSFSTRLKRSYLFAWYRPKLNDPWKRLSRNQRRNRFRIDQIAFFKKHFWFHFNQAEISGWIPVKHFRKNYCLLNLSPYKSNLKISASLSCTVLMCLYVRPQSNVSQMIRQYQSHRPHSVDEFFSIVADQVGRFQNVSHKSMRRIRHQIWHQRPVVMALILDHHVRHVVVVGFNRRVFSYIAPTSDKLQLITRKRLIKAWQKFDYRAFSC